MDHQLTSPAPFLAPEIVSKVLGFVNPKIHQDWRTFKLNRSRWNLCGLARISDGWLIETQRRIFHDVSIVQEPRWNLLKVSLESKPELGKSTEHFHLYLPSMTTKDVFSILKLFPFLKKMSLATHELFVPPLDDRIFTPMNYLTCLRYAPVGERGYRDDSEMLKIIIDHAPNLEVLDLFGHQMEDWDNSDNWDIDGFEYEPILENWNGLSRKLKRLVVISHPIGSIISGALLPVSYFTGLQELKVDAPRYNPTNSSEFGHFIETAALKRLEFPSTSAVNIGYHLRNPYLSNLELISIENVGWDGPGEDIGQRFFDILPRTLRVINIGNTEGLEIALSDFIFRLDDQEVGEFNNLGMFSIGELSEILVLTLIPKTRVLRICRFSENVNLSFDQLEIGAVLQFKKLIMSETDRNLGVEERCKRWNIELEFTGECLDEFIVDPFGGLMC